MIIIVSILIIFFMCKRRDDPIYKVNVDKLDYRSQGLPVQVKQGQGQGQGQQKGKVKEWYV
jgi:hypothetical protein